MTETDPLFEQIASNVAGIDTLETRNSDSLDFHSIACWTIKELLEKAYLAGLSQDAPLKIRTEDGYTFYRNKSGRYVDNLDENLVDTSYASLSEFDVGFTDVSHEDDDNRLTP